MNTQSDDYLKLSGFSLKPDCTMKFWHEPNHDCIGTLDWNDGKLKFSGNTEESARLLFDWLSNLFEDKIAERVEQRLQELQRERDTE